jgi:hypothetical protein
MAETTTDKHICIHIYTSLYSHINKFYLEISKKRRDVCIAETTTDSHIYIYIYVNIYIFYL